LSQTTKKIGTTDPTALDWKQNATLIVGPRKSGTTLLQSLLDGLDGLLVLPGELKLKKLTDFDSLPVDERWPRYLDTARSLFHLDRAVTPAAGTNDCGVAAIELVDDLPVDRFDQPKYKALLQEPPNNAPITLRTAIVHDLQASRASVIGDAPVASWLAKEAGGRIGTFIPQFKAMFPAARIITIVRQPKAVLAALCRDRIRKGVRFSMSDMLRSLREMRSIFAYAVASRDCPDRRVVVYEKLVAAPEPSLKSLAVFLGLDPRSIVAEPTSLGEAITVSTASRSDAGVFTATAERWGLGLSWWQRITIAMLMAADRLLSNFVPQRQSTVELFDEAAALARQAGQSEGKSE